MSDAPRLGAVTWRTSSYSSGNGGDCVMVGDGLRDAVPVRDSKVPAGRVIVFHGRAWSAFVVGVAGGPAGAFSSGADRVR